MKLFGFYPIAKEGLPLICTFSALTTIIFILAIYLQSCCVFFIIFLVSLILTIFLISFFRDPERVTPTGNNLVISPADGTVIFIGTETEHRILKKQTQKISIFMSPLNVHINRMPMTGEVTNIVYNHGKYLNAASPKASLDNEQNAVVLRSTTNKEIMFVQIAGFLARRIVCHLKIGETRQVGQRMGLIKLGSRVDLYLPTDAKIKVKLGDKTTSGQTVMAEF